MTNIETQIASDLNLIDMVQAFGTTSSKRNAAKQRKAIFQYLKDTTPAEIKAMSDDELLAALGA